MWTWLQNEPGADAWSRALAVLVDAGVKGIVLLALAGLVALAMRRASAAARHLVWTLALCGLLLLPVLSLVVPKWQLPILPGPATPVERALPASREPVTPAVKPEWRETAPVETETPTQFPSSISPPAPVVSHPAPMPTPVPSAPGTSPRPVAYWVLVAWLAVALVILTPLLVGFAVVARLRWNAVPFTGDGLPELARSLVESLGLHRPVTLLCTGPEMMPMTSGLLRPVVFLPREAGDWPDDKLRAVLLHELAHVKRRECLTHAVARVAAAVHWFNPLAWLALRRLRIERERACDDVVLTAGARASAYADHLLEIARTMHAGTLASAAAITIAKKGQFEGRLLAILDATRNRGAATLGRLMVAAGVSVVLLLACSAVQLSASAARDAGGDGRKWRDKAYIFPGFDATEFTQFHYEFSQFPYGIGGDWEHYFKADRQGQPLDYAYFHRQLGPEDFRFQIRHLDGETVYVVGDCLQTRKGRRLVALDREGRRYVAEVAKDIPARVMFPASLLVVYNGSHGSASNLKGGIGPNDGNATSGFPGAVSEVEWEYLGRKDGGWRFEFTRRFPIDVPPDQPEKTQTTRKEEVYRGGTLTIFEDNHQWIGIEPADEPPLEEEARIVGRWRGGGSGDGTAMTFWSDHRWSASDSGGSTDSGRWSFLDGKYRLERENGELLPFDVYVNESGLRMVSQSEPDEVFALERDEPPETRPADGDSSYRGEAGGAADEVRSILSGLEAGPFDGEFELTDSARERLIHLLPGAADVLFAIVVADEEDFLTRRRAGGVLLRLWGELSRESIESFLDTHARAYVHARPQYPQGIVAYVGTGYHFPGGAGLWRRGRGLTIHTVTRQTLDGQPTREPFHYDGPSASAGGIAIEDLSRGRHTAHVSTEYEIAYQGRVIKGKVESGPVTFEVGPSSSPDLLAAPPDPELERQVRDSLGITEVNEQTRYASRFHVLDPWEPQTYWREHDGHEEVGLHVPLWQLTEPLPVDLSLDVEFHVEHTGEVLRGDPLVVLKNRKQGGHFYPNDTRAFTAGREGFVPLRIVLKPSRAQALSTLEVTQYYNGPPITSEVVRAKVDRYRESEANAVVLRLREMHMEVTGLKRSTASPEELKRILAGGINENEQVYLAIENMTALNPHTRRLGASSLAFPSGLPVEPALPFLVELLGDPDVALPTTPAGEAARALAAIGTPAIPPLVGALKHENPEVRQRAAYALNDMGSNEMRDAMTPLVAEPLIELSLIHI